MLPGRRPGSRVLGGYGENAARTDNVLQQEVNGEPQVAALCWLLDFDSSGDNRWDGFSLSTQTGELIEAAREFDALLAERP